MTPIRLLVLMVTCVLATSCIRIRVHDAERLGLTLCARSEQMHERWVLYFGRQRADGTLVSATAWQQFLDEEVTPRFPAGLTWLDAHGQWRAEDGAGVQEPVYQLILLTAEGPEADVPDANQSERDIHAVSRAYRHRFQQQAVLIERTRVCSTLDRTHETSP